MISIYMKVLFKRQNNTVIFIKGIIFIITIVGNCYCQYPAWINSEGKETFPDDEYLTGFSIGEKTRREQPENFENRIKQNARMELVEQFNLSIRAKTVYKVVETNDSFSDSFTQDIELYSDLENANFPIKFFYDEKKKVGYSIAYLNKKETLLKIKYIIYTKYYKLIDYIRNADESLESGRLGIAINSFFESYGIIEELYKLKEEYSFFDNGIEIGIEYNTIERENYINNKLYAIKSEEATSIEDLCHLVYLNIEDLENINSEFLYLDYVYLDDALVPKTQFSEIFRNMLISRLNESEKHKTIDYKPISNHYILSGNYWVLDNSLKIIIKIHSINNNRTCMYDMFEVKITKLSLDNDGVVYFDEQNKEININISDSISNWVATTFNDKIRGMYCDKSDNEFIYISINDYEIISNDKILLLSKIRKKSETNDINIEWNLKDGEIVIPKLGRGKINLSNNEISFSSYFNNLSDWKFIKTL